MRLALLSVLLLLSSAEGALARNAATQVERREVRAPVQEGSDVRRTREYWVYKPKAYATSSSTPLVIVFHGGGGSAAATGGFSQDPAGWSAARRWNDVAEREGALVIYPEGQPLDWSTPTGRRYWKVCNPGRRNDPEDQDWLFIAAMIEAIAADPAFRKVDLSRVYVFGHSNGGAMARTMLQKLGGRIAGAALSSSNLAAIDDNGVPDFAGCAPPAVRPIVLQAGTSDPLDKFEGGAGGSGTQKASTEQSVAYWRERLGVGADARSTRVKGPGGVTPDGRRRDRDGCPLPVAACSDRYDPTGLKIVSDSTVDHQVWGGRDAAAPLHLFRVEGGGHTIPDTAYAMAGAWNPDAADFPASESCGTAALYNAQHQSPSAAKCGTGPRALGAQNADFDFVESAWEILRKHRLPARPGD